VPGIQAATEKVPLKRKAENDVHISTSDTPNRRSQTLMECIDLARVHWPATSMEQQKREKALVQMVLDTGTPLTLISHPSFRNMLKIFDAKFRIPGRPM